MTGDRQTSKRKGGVEYWESKETKRLAASKLILLLAASLLQPQNALTVLSLWIPSQPTAARYPRNVIVENGLLLVKFGALNLNEYAVKASLNGARALGLKNKGHLSSEPMQTSPFWTFKMKGLCHNC